MTLDVTPNAFAIAPSTEIRIWSDKKPVSLTAVVTTGLSDAAKDSVAWGIFRNLEEKVEFTQGNAGEWFTYFSFEDLTSNQIGFYLALKYGKIVNPSNGEVKKNDLAWDHLSDICGFPKNRQQAIFRSQQVYRAIPVWSKADPFFSLLGNTPRVFTWGTPLLCELNGICDDEPKRWPAELNVGVPAEPVRNGQWWFYNSNLDGQLVNTQDSQFYYLKK